MSKKIGLIGISLSLAVTASLGSSLYLIKEFNDNNKIVNKNIETLTAQVESNTEKISTLGGKSLSDGSTGTDMEMMSTRLMEIENQILGLSQKVNEIPDFVQLNEEGNVVQKPTTPPPTLPEPTTPVIITPEVVQTTPTLSNPVFKTNAKLNFRADASLKSQVKKTLAVGETLTWIDNLQKVVDGYTWIKVADSAGNSGWVAQEYTVKQN